MPDGNRQFRVLYRDFLARLVDLEILSADGDASKLFTQFAALLGAFSFVVSLFLVPQYAFSGLHGQRRALAALGDESFFIAMTMAVVGVFAVVSWNAVFPDRREALILGVLPVKAGTIFRAKISAIATGLGVSVVAVNAVIGLTYPFLIATEGSGFVGILRAMGAYWLTMIAAGVFVFSALLAVQGVAAQVLSFRLFQRVSNLLQIGSFFLVLGLFFLTPGPSELPVTAQKSEALLGYFPAFWFLGLFQVLNGPIHPVFGGLALKALWGMAISVGIAAVTYGLAYMHTIRRLMEEPDIAPGDRFRPMARLGSYLARKFVGKPLERAILLFTARTLARSRQHRVILAAYAGIGLAISLAYSKILLFGNSSLYAPARRFLSVPRWYELNVPLMATGFVMLFFMVIGTRAVFSLPASLKANWIFRITDVHSPKSYFQAVRKALYAVSVLPVWLTAAAIYLTIWPRSDALRYLLVMALCGWIVVDRRMTDFRKLPFACSYLPGKSDLTRKLAPYGILFLTVSDVGTRIVYWSMEGWSRYAVIVAILAAMAWRSRQRWTQYASVPYQRVQFEELAEMFILPLDIRRDGAWGPARYVDMEVETPRPWRERLTLGLRRVALVTLILAVFGAVYEQYGQWKHRREFPQVGRSVDIGGRSLNLYCSGQGSPTVVFESPHGQPGYSWVFVQREVAKTTRACWYDRAGEGWSDAGPFPRDSAAVARDLHSLLQAAQVAGPYVLAGAASGGLDVRVYGGLYPDKVAGMVLVDATHVDEQEKLPDGASAVSQGNSAVGRALGALGVWRFLADRDPGRPAFGLSPEEWRVVRSFEARWMAEQAKETPLRSAAQARQAPDLGERPLIILTAGLSSREATNLHEARRNEAAQKRWIETQAQMQRLSTRVKQVVLSQSRHLIQYDDPWSVIEAVREVVVAARSGGEY